MITVMFASYNGGERLKRTLDSMIRVRSPRGGWRLIAVDNRSTDDSRDVMLSYEGKLPIDVLKEPAPGKNRALNRAVDMAITNGVSDLFVFCDDDVLVSEDWLVEWRAVADAHLECDAFAGLTLPHWPFDPPEWILRHVHLPIVYATHQNMHEGDCDLRCMHGTNMAVRAAIFRSGYRFDARIGPDGSPVYAMGSETNLALRLAQLGCKCWFAEKPVVRHIIRPEQMEARWVLGRAYRYGRGVAFMGGNHISPVLLAVKNAVKAFVYPWAIPMLAEDAGWRRRWQWAFDQGYEDGTLERNGKPSRWRRS